MLSMYARPKKKSLQPSLGQPNRNHLSPSPPGERRQKLSDVDHLLVRVWPVVSLPAPHSLAPGLAVGADGASDLSQSMAPDLVGESLPGMETQNWGSPQALGARESAAACRACLASLPRHSHLIWPTHLLQSRSSLCHHWLCFAFLVAAAHAKLSCLEQDGARWSK